MPYFQYKAVAPDGRVVEGTLEAPDERVALARLEEQGQLPIKVFTGEEGGLLGRRSSNFPGNENGFPAANY